MIYFIGGGFGSAEYLTVKGASLLRKANIVIYSKVLDKSILRICSKKCKLISAGEIERDRINEILKKNQKGITVYLTDGDFAFFGAVQSSFDFCIENGIRFEVIPGISAVSASASMLAKEMTMPNISQCVIVTYAEDQGLMIDKQKISELAKHNATMFIYMVEIKNLSYISNSLMEGGYSENTPVVIIKNLLSHNSEIIVTTVKDLSSVKYYGKAVIIVGNILLDEKRRRQMMSMSITNFRVAEKFNKENCILYNKGRRIF